MQVSRFYFSHWLYEAEHFTRRYCLTIQSLYGACAQWFVTILERVWGDQDFVMLFLLVIYSIKGQCWRRCNVRQYLVCIYVLICFWGFRFLLFSFSFSLFHPSSMWSVRMATGCSWVLNWEVSQEWRDCPTLNIYDINRFVCLCFKWVMVDNW